MVCDSIPLLTISCNLRAVNAFTVGAVNVRCDEVKPERDTSGPEV